MRTPGIHSLSAVNGVSDSSPESAPREVCGHLLVFVYDSDVRSQTLKRGADARPDFPRKQARTSSPHSVIDGYATDKRASNTSSLRYPLQHLLRSAFVECDFAHDMREFYLSDRSGVPTAIRHQLRDAMRELCDKLVGNVNDLVEAVPPPMVSGAGDDITFLMSVHRQLVIFMRSVFIYQRTSQEYDEPVAMPRKSRICQALRVQLVESIEELYKLSQKDVEVVLSLLPPPVTSV